MTTSTKETYEEKTEQKTISTPITNEVIAEKAYRNFVHRGCVHGFDKDDWLRAEKELLDEVIGTTS
jgi:hypothetical protein